MGQPGKGSGPAPSAALPLRYVVAAILGLLLAAVGAAGLAPELAGHYYHPRVVALTHMVTLGWTTFAILGATYQMAPIVLERPIWSERLARWTFLLLSAGLVGMLGHFYIASWPGLAWAAGLTALGGALHIANVALGMRGLQSWTFTARMMALALAGLGLTIAFGVVLALDRIWKFLPGEVFPTLHAHFHLALLGWITPMVMGVAARVYPMFLSAPEPTGWPGALQFWGLAAGVPAVTLGLLALPPLLAPGAFAVLAAIAGHMAWVSAMAADRRRPELDWGLRLALTGTGLLLPAAGLGLGFALDLIAGPRLGLAYAVLALGGWVSLTICGMLLKIVPFLVWYRVYGPLAGRSPVPDPMGLSQPGAEALACGLLGVGTVGLAGAVAIGDERWIRLAAAGLVIGALALAVALGRVLTHLGPRGRG